MFWWSADTHMSKAEAPSRSLMMSLVNRRVGPASIRQRFWKTKIIKLSLSIWNSNWNSGKTKEESETSQRGPQTKCYLLHWGHGWAPGWKRWLAPRRTRAGQPQWRGCWQGWWHRCWSSCWADWRLILKRRIRARLKILSEGSLV